MSARPNKRALLQIHQNLRFPGSCLPDPAVTKPLSAYPTPPDPTSFSTSFLSSSLTSLSPPTCRRLPCESRKPSSPLADLRRKSARYITRNSENEWVKPDLTECPSVAARELIYSCCGGQRRRRRWRRTSRTCRRWSS
jgi:hypothetical protein